MTIDPRLPTLEEVMNGNPFDIIDSPWGHIERWRASTLATGTMGALADVYSIVRADAAEAVARADAEQARSALVKHVCERVDSLTSRVDALASKLEAAEARRAADAARHDLYDQEPIEFPPEFDFRPPDEPQEDDQTHDPSGELHVVQAKREGAKSEDQGPVSELPEPPLETEPTPTPSGHAYPQPIAISLNEA